MKIKKICNVLKEIANRDVIWMLDMIIMGKKCNTNPEEIERFIHEMRVKVQTSSALRMIRIINPHSPKFDNKYYHKYLKYYNKNMKENIDRHNKKS